MYDISVIILCLALLTAFVTLWSIAPFKRLFTADGPLYSWVASLHVPFLDNVVQKTPPIVAEPTPFAAVYKFDWFSATGTAILIAALITIATWFATRETFVFFGILHHIAFASLAGLFFLGLPWWALAAIAAAIFIGTPFLQSPIFTPLGMVWTGLSSTPPRSNDFVPVLPWFSAVLAGMAAAKLVFIARTPPRVLTPEGWSANSPLSRLLALFGRWSLTFYLAHQPILIGLVFLVSLAFPAQPPSFSASCSAACTAQFEAEPCAVYCACAEAELEAAGKLESLLSEPETARSDLETSAIIAQCAFEAGITGDGRNR